MIKAKKVRNPSIDVVRIFALLLVVSVHFFLNIGYYNVTFAGEKMLVATMVRTLCKACVPMFILLTGYLMHKKTLSAKYYLGVVKTLGIYVLASVFCVLFKNYYLYRGLTLKMAIAGILDFSAADYAWYVEMYIGLFLAIPFLNAMYHGMGTKKRKLILVGTFLFLSSAYTVVNIFDFHTPGWWQNPRISVSYDEIVPDFYSEIYPFSIYLIGAALSDFKVKMKRLPNILLIAGITAILGAYTYYRSYGRTFIWGPWQGDRAVFIVAIAALLIIFIAGFDMTKTPAWISRILKTVADSVLGAYLVSYVFDTIFYKKLNTAVPEIYNRYPYFFVIVPLVFICSILTSMGLNVIWWAISTPVAKLIGAIRRKPSAEAATAPEVSAAEADTKAESEEKQPELTEIK